MKYDPDLPYDARTQAIKAARAALPPKGQRRNLILLGTLNPLDGLHPCPSCNFAVTSTCPNGCAS